MDANKVVAKTASPPMPPALSTASATPAADVPQSVVVAGHVEHGRHRARGHARPLFEVTIVRRAIVDAFKKLDPRHQVRNPVMFLVEVGSVLTTALFVQPIAGKGEAPAGFIFAVSIWLWFTVVFANFAEAMAEGRGKAQAESLRRARKDISAKKLAQPRRDAVNRPVLASE